MRFAFQFSNLLGAVYKKGNVLFTSDGKSLLSPVGNRVSIFDLVNNSAFTLPFQNSKNISRIALSPKDDLLISIDEDGRSLLVNFQRRTVLSQYNFRGAVGAIKFDPSGKHFAVSVGSRLQIYKAPPKQKEFSPFSQISNKSIHYEDITCITWSPDSKFILTGSKDSSAKLTQVGSAKGEKVMKPVSLLGHRTQIVNCFFGKENHFIYTVSQDGALFVWKWKGKEHASYKQVVLAARESNAAIPTQEEFFGKRYLSPTAGSWAIKKKHFFLKKATSAEFYKAADLLVVGFKRGTFELLTLPDCSIIHTLSIGTHSISSVAINGNGEWLALASKKLGQLVVWEWQSETYLLKQQGHFFEINSVCYSPDGQYLVTGGDDKKVKVWNTRSGFCFITFNQHAGPVTHVLFSPKGNGNAVFSASSDGTVRAFDLIRYRNFRTFVAPNPCQFTCLALDPSGEIVCKKCFKKKSVTKARVVKTKRKGDGKGAGNLDTFEIYVWSVQTGKLLDVLHGHEGPISSISFHPTLPHLVSASWDRTCRTWDIFRTNQQINEILQHDQEVLCVSFRPDGKEICTATTDGLLNFWETQDSLLKSSIEGRKDITIGRSIYQKVTSKTLSASSYFSTICYNADGTCILAGGNSKYICIYHIEHQILLKKFQISSNLSLDGILDRLDSRKLTDAGNIDLLESGSDEDDDSRRSATYLPGVKKGDLSARKNRPMIRTKSVNFSPTGRSFAAATTEGLLIYSLDETLVFDPFDLDIEITPDNIMLILNNKEFLKALIMSFKLNEKHLIKTVFEATPVSEIQTICSNLPPVYLSRMLSFFGNFMENSPHLEFILMWCLYIFIYHGRTIKSDINSYLYSLRNIQKNLIREQSDISKICDENTYMMGFLSSFSDRLEAEDGEHDEDDIPEDLLDNAQNTTGISFFNPFSADSDGLKVFENKSVSAKDGETTETKRSRKKRDASNVPYQTREEIQEEKEQETEMENEEKKKKKKKKVKEPLEESKCESSHNATAESSEKSGVKKSALSKRKRKSTDFV